jgi:hypothetical protein
MIMIVERKDHYGMIRFYPVNDTAQKFSDLLGRMTFDIGHLKRIKEIGIPVEVKQEVVIV